MVILKLEKIQNTKKGKFFTYKIVYKLKFNLISLIKNKMDFSIELYDFFNGDELSDLKIIVENRTLFVHKAILGIYFKIKYKNHFTGFLVLGTVSPVFKKMLTSNLKESQENLIYLPDKKLDDILILLKMVYPNYPKDIEENQVQILLELSEEYLINNLKLIIEKYLIKKVQDLSKSKLYGKEIELQIEFLVDLINLSLNYNLKKLIVSSTESLAIKFNKSQLESSSKFNELHDSIKLKVYSKKIDILQEKLNSANDKLKQNSDANLRKKYSIMNKN